MRESKGESNEPPCLHIRNTKHTHTHTLTPTHARRLTMMMLRVSTRSCTQGSRLYCSSSHVPNSATVPRDYLSLRYRAVTVSLR